MSNYNDDINRSISNQILKLNQQYINHIKGIETGMNGSGFSGGNEGMKEYQKDSYHEKGGARLSTKPVKLDPIQEVKPEIKSVAASVASEPQSFQLPTQESEQPKEDDGWFHKAKKWVGDFFGGRKPTKKEREEIEKIFKLRGHDIKSKGKLRGGFKIGDLGNTDFWNSLRIEGGSKPADMPDMQGGFKIGDLGNTDFWNGLRVEGGKKPKGKALKGAGFFDDIGDFFSNTKNGITDAVANVTRKGQKLAHDLGLGKPQKKKATKGAGKPNARASIVKKYMDENKCSMIEASKKVKSLNLY